MWDLLGSLFCLLGSLFAGGNPFHGSVEFMGLSRNPRLSGWHASRVFFFSPL